MGKEERTADDIDPYDWKCLASDVPKFLPNVRFYYHSGFGVRASILEALLQSFTSPRILEVGVCQGDMPKHLLKSHRRASYVGVDPWMGKEVDDNFKLSSENVKAFGSRAQLHRGNLT